MLTITHTHAAGTLIVGTSRGDGTAEILKLNGWRWGRSIGKWFMPNSRDHLPNLATITRTADTLRTAGFVVDTTMSTEHRTTAEVEADKIVRQADWADTLTTKADRKTAADDGSAHETE